MVSLNWFFERYSEFATLVLLCVIVQTANPTNGIMANSKPALGPKIFSILLQPYQIPKGRETLGHFRVFSVIGAQGGGSPTKISKYKIQIRTHRIGPPQKLSTILELGQQLHPHHTPLPVVVTTPHKNDTPFWRSWSCGRRQHSPAITEQQFLGFGWSGAEPPPAMLARTLPGHWLDLHRAHPRTAAHLLPLVAGLPTVPSLLPFLFAGQEDAAPLLRLGGVRPLAPPQSGPLHSRHRVRGQQPPSVREHL